MSEYQVLAIFRALLRDPVVGLKAKVDALVLALAPASAIRSDFNYTRWAFGAVTNPATKPNVMLRPGAWAGDEKLGTGQRDATAVVDVGYEIFGTDPDEIEDNVTIVAAAVAQCAVDELRAYSDAHGGTIVDVVDPFTVQFGEFAGSGVGVGAASSGFLARITVQERSSL